MRFNPDIRHRIDADAILGERPGPGEDPRDAKIERLRRERDALIDSRVYRLGLTREGPRWWVCLSSNFTGSYGTREEAVAAIRRSAGLDPIGGDQ